MTINASPVGFACEQVPQLRQVLAVSGRDFWHWEAPKGHSPQAVGSCKSTATPRHAESLRARESRNATQHQAAGHGSGEQSSQRKRLS